MRAESVGFPLAAQGARLRREVEGRTAEEVALLTSLPPARLDARRWLELNRAHWGIENGLHARLDVSRRDDQSRLRAPNAVWVHGLFARLANSLLLHWRERQRNGRHKTTTDFAGWMSAAHCRRALHTLTARQPSFGEAS